MKYLFVCYPGCSTCKKAKEWLVNHAIQYEERNIRQENPSSSELSEWIERSDYPIKKFFNAFGKSYKNLSIKDKLVTMSKEESIQLLSTDGMLLKRPMVIGNDVVLVGFKEQEWEKAFAVKQ